MFGFSERHKKKEKERIIKVIEAARAQAQALNSMLNFVNDFGNLNRRKKHKLRKDDYINIRNQILELPLALNASMSIIRDDNSLLRRFNKLMKAVEGQVKKELDDRRREELKRKVTKVLF